MKLLLTKFNFDVIEQSALKGNNLFRFFWNVKLARRDYRKLEKKVLGMMLISVDFAVQQAHDAVYFNHGQCCCAGTRTFVEGKIYDEFVQRSKELAEKKKLGDPFDLATEQGPQVLCFFIAFCMFANEKHYGHVMFVHLPYCVFSSTIELL